MLRSGLLSTALKLRAHPLSQPRGARQLVTLGHPLAAHAPLSARHAPGVARLSTKAPSRGFLPVAGAVTRWALIATGSAVWLWHLYEWYDPDGADELLGYDIDKEYDKEARRFYDVGSTSSADAQEELDAKDAALYALLQKLEKQPELTSSLGRDLAMWPGAYPLPGGPEKDSSEAQDGRTWCPSFFLNGPHGCCAVQVTMVKNKVEEWVPTSLHIERMERSGKVLLRARAGLPHGLAYINRLNQAYDGIGDVDV